MSVWTGIVKALPLQVAGTISVALSILMISRTYGPVVQGEFAYFKSLVEFFGPLVLLGAPQALLYFVRSDRLSRDQGAILGVAYAPLIFVVTLFGVQIGRTFTGQPLPIQVSPVVLAFCASCFGLATSVRGLVLASGHHALFGILSCLPQMTCLLLLLVVPRQKVGHISDFYVAGWLAGALLAIAWCAWGLLRRRRGLDRRALLPRLLPFLRYGLATYVPSVCAAASLLLTLIFIEQVQGKTSVGNFSIVTTILQMVVMPILLLAPSLFYSWTSAGEDEYELRNRQFSLINRCVIAYTLLCCLSQWLLLDLFVEKVLGNGFEQTVPAASILMLGYLPACLETASVPLLYALGHPVAVAAAAGIKATIIISLPMTIHIASPLAPLDLPGMAAGWAAAQWAGWLTLVWYLHRIGVCRLGHAVGLAPIGLSVRSWTRAPRDEADSDET